MFLKSDTTRQRFSQRLAQPRFGPLWFSPRAPRLGAEKKAPTTFDRPPPRRGWGADYSEPRHLGCYGARELFCGARQRRRYGALVFRGSASTPRAPRLDAEKTASSTFGRPPPRRGWGADYSEPRHLGCYGARELFCGARQRRRYGALVFRGSTSSWVGLPRPKTLTNQLALDLDSCKICPAADVLQQVRNAGK